MIHRFFHGISKVRMVLCFILVSTWTLCNCIFIELNAQLISSLINKDADGYVLIWKYVTLIASWCVIEYLLDISIESLSANCDCATFSNGFNEIYNTRPEVLKKANAGYVTGLIRTLQSKRRDLAIYMTTDLFMAIVYTCYFAVRVWRYHYIFSILLVSVVTLGSIIRVFGRRLVMPITNRLIEADSVVTKTFIDISTNINTVQKMHADKFMHNKLDDELDTYWDSMVRNVKANDVFYCVFKFVVYMFAPICLILTVMYDFGFDKIEFYALISPLSVQLVHMAKCIGSFFKRLDLYISAQKKFDNIVNETTVNNSELITQFNTIAVRNADYTYTHEVTKEKVHVIIPYMSIQKGDRVCVYGESGQGKTTALNILSRQLKTNNVYVDGRLTEDQIDCVFISQDTEIFDMSVRDNLTLGNPNISDSELIYMLVQVGLGDWYKSQSSGLDTMLGERGVFVSTGLRQRLNLIRGLLISDKELYLLDEPTSNIDEYTEQRMVELINERIGDKTFVIVSHRKAVFSICNRFYRFENGVCGDKKDIVNV